MAEAAAKEKVCSACGADIRADSLFCYACGGSLEAELAELEQTEPEAKVEEEVQDDSVKENKDEKIAIKAKSSEVESKSKNSKKKELKTAASLRKKPKNMGVKRVEVVWEEHENAPNVWFLVGATIFTIIGAILFYLAMYLQ